MFSHEPHQHYTPPQVYAALNSYNYKFYKATKGKKFVHTPPCEWGVCASLGHLLCNEADGPIGLK